jgi:hypothetical protein
MKFGIVSSAQVDCGFQAGLARFEALGLDAVDIGCDGLAKAVAFLRPLLPSP